MNRRTARSKGPAEATQRPPQKAKQKANKNGHMPARELAKVTLYVRPDQVIAIEDIQLRERKRTGSRPDKSVLVQEALDLLVEKYRARK